ncbi:MAG: helix-turn-helix domain-containing protein [Pseudonocardiales bacterium]|nr:helix-turn-helix domain-containing protein [Pseudonocardiales bacterium]
MARQPPELTEQQRALGRYLAALREAAGLYQMDIARAVPCHRTTVTHAEAGSQLPDAHFWETADHVVGANGALIARYDAFIQAKHAYAAKQQAQRRAKARARAQQLRLAPLPESSGGSSTLGSASSNPPPSQLEILRRSLNEAIVDRTITVASLDDWEQTVFQHGRTTRDRAPSVLLNDLKADLVGLHGALVRCRSSSALRRLTRVTAQMAGLMCLTLIKMDERTAFRGWARTARLAADEAGDPLTHSWVRAQEAYGHYYSGNLTEAIHVAQHAQALSGKVSSVGAALAAALEARAQAALGRADETRFALQRAEACLSHLDAGSIGTSAFDYNEAQLRFHEGNAFTHLHDTSAAWPAQDRALSLCPTSDYMDRTMTRLDRAHCLAYNGDVSGAVAIVVEATTSLTSLQRHGIIATRVRETIAILPAQHRALPAVRDLHDLLPPSPKTKDNA